MPQHDPFPMTSPEAQQLAASVVTTNSDVAADHDTNNNITNNWSTMNLRSAERGPIDDHDDTDPTARGRLLKGGSPSKAASSYIINDDIYAAHDLDAGDAREDDDFLDRPMWASRGTAAEQRLVRVLQFLERIYVQLYGDQLPLQEMLRTLCLAMTLFFMIGGYWLLRSLKDPIITALCGVTAIPKAKILSVFVVLVVVSIYNHFLDSDIPRHYLFYIFGSFYGLLFFIIALLLMHPTIGLPNEQPSLGRVLGWISYCAIESFGSVMVSLFWSFCNSNFTLETAKASYGVMVAMAQVGSILGPTVVKRYSKTLGVAKCYLLGAVTMLLLQATMYLYIYLYGTAERNVKPGLTVSLLDHKTTKASTGMKKEKPGILEGLYLFVQYNYVKGIFAITCLFMVEVTIIDFTMKLLAKEYFADEYPCQFGMSCYDTNPDGVMGMSQQATEEFTSFMGFFGQATNTLSLLLSLLGTSAVIRFLGLRWSLLLFPTICLAVIVFVRMYPTLYVVFGAMMILKACSYALNNPTKEILYQPTSPAVRYKAKSWIDIFGDRAAKAFGSLVTNAFSDNAASLIANGSFVGMAVASFLIWNATFMGRTFDQYMASGYIVGAAVAEHAIVETEFDDDDGKNMEMAMAQNEVDDTSCAIHEDNQVSPEEEGQGSNEPVKKADVQMV